MEPLASYQFGTIVRYAKTSSLERVNVLRTATHATLKRLGISRDRSQAVKGLPQGSDQGDLRSLIDWMGKLGPSDTEAIAQVVALDATAVARSES